MPDRPWTREEVLLTISLYCKLPYRKLRQSTPEVRELAVLLDRTPSAVSKRCCNYVQFDSVESQRVKGLELTLFHGHLIVHTEGVRSVQTAYPQAAVSGAIS